MRYVINAHVVRYNHEKFWRRYLACQEHKVSGIKRIYYIYYLKRVMSKHCCDLMIALTGREDFGAYFETQPFLPHGLNGIVVSNQARIGKHATILQQVTIGVKDISTKGASVLGDYVTVGAGAKIIGAIKIGNSVTIGANAVVTKDIPDGATVVGNPARIIRQHGERM